MGEHPSPKKLKGFLLGRLEAHEARAVVAHLLGDCPRCKTLMTPISAAMFHPGREPEVPAERDQAYESAFSAAFATAQVHHRRLVHERAEAENKINRLLYGTLPQDAEFWTPVLCEALLEKISELRHRDSQGMLHLAKLATEVAQRLDAKLYGPEIVGDLQALAWAELSNALRVTDKLSLAEPALAHALDARRRGTGSPLVRARISELAASLLCDLRQFPNAFRLLDMARSLYSRKGQSHSAGRALIQKGIHTGRSGDPEEAIRLLSRGLQLIDRNRDPKLVFQVLHNLLLFRVELGEYRVARRQLWEMRPLYKHHGDPIALIKLRGLEGRIYFGLGKLGYAEMAFRQARESFEREGLFYDAALISFDLAAVWLIQGKKAEVQHLVTRMLETFRSRYIAREAIAALLMLREAVNRNDATVDLFEVVADLFKGLRDEPQSDPG